MTNIRKTLDLNIKLPRTGKRNVKRKKWVVDHRLILIIRRFREAIKELEQSVMDLSKRTLERVLEMV